MQFIGLVHKEPASDYGVSFPDLPGVVTAGRTADEATAMAAEALTLHLAGIVVDRLTIPTPSSLEKILADPQNRDGTPILVKSGMTVSQSR
jgi:predicted RNase H-like HicB family nuclease